MAEDRDLDEYDEGQQVRRKTTRAKAVKLNGGVGWGGQTKYSISLGPFMTRAAPCGVALAFTFICVWFLVFEALPQPTRQGTRANRCSWCKAGFVLKADAADVECSGITCKDPNVCCDPQPKCSTLNCGSWHVRKLNAPSLFCAGTVCSFRSDGKKCCERKAMCSSLRQIKPGFGLKLDAANIFCAGVACDLEKDMVACTEPLARATCDSLDCGFGSALKPRDARPFYCAGMPCTHDADWAKCCELRAKCSSMSEVKRGYVLKADAKDRWCGGARCDIERDIAECCEPQAKCATLFCGPESALLPGASSTFCMRAKCTLNDDWGHCCESKSRAKCSTLTHFEDGFILKPYADSILCAGFVCNKEIDRDVCLDPKLRMKAELIGVVIAVAVLLIFASVYEFNWKGAPIAKNDREASVPQSIREARVAEKIKKVPKERIVYVDRVVEKIKEVPKVEFVEKIVHSHEPAPQPMQHKQVFPQSRCLEAPQIVAKRNTMQHHKIVEIPGHIGTCSCGTKLPPGSDAFCENCGKRRDEGLAVQGQQHHQQGRAHAVTALPISQVGSIRCTPAVSIRCTPAASRAVSPIQDYRVLAQPQAQTSPRNFPGSPVASQARSPTQAATFAVSPVRRAGVSPGYTPHAAAHSPISSVRAVAPSPGFASYTPTLPWSSAATPPGSERRYSQ